MKRFLQITLILVISGTFAFAAIQGPVFHVTDPAGLACPNVGWNTTVCMAYNPTATILLSLAWAYPPVFTPNVGWNT
jgi:hypothetical protein